MKMVTTKQAQKMLEERGIAVSYPTIAQWTREGRFKGAEREETERGPVWRIPVESVKSFDPPKPGRPSDKSPTNGTPKDPAETTAQLNRAFRKAKEAEEAGTKGTTKKAGKKGAG